MPLVSEHNGRRLYRHKQLLFGAQRGFIVVFDERDGTTNKVDCAEFELRAEALGLEAARCVYGPEREELIDAANCMEAAVADAMAQGNPLDPKVQAYHARHRSKCGSTILVGAGTAELGPGVGGNNAKASRLPKPPAAAIKGGVLLPSLLN